MRYILTVTVATVQNGPHSTGYATKESPMTNELDHGNEYDDEHFGGRGMRSTRAMSSTPASTALANCEWGIPIAATTLQTQVASSNAGIRGRTQRPLWLIGTVAG